MSIVWPFRAANESRWVLTAHGGLSVQATFAEFFKGNVSIINLEARRSEPDRSLVFLDLVLTATGGGISYGWSKSALGALEVSGFVRGQECKVYKHPRHPLELLTHEFQGDCLLVSYDLMKAQAGPVSKNVSGSNFLFINYDYSGARNEAARGDFPIPWEAQTQGGAYKQAYFTEENVSMLNHARAGCVIDLQSGGPQAGIDVFGGSILSGNITVKGIKKYPYKG